MAEQEAIFATIATAPRDAADATFCLYYSCAVVLISRLDLPPPPSRLPLPLLLRVLLYNFGYHVFDHVPLPASDCSMHDSHFVCVNDAA